MYQVVVTHKIESYPKWKKVFDESEELRRQTGFLDGYICRDANDANQLIITLRTQDLTKAREFMKSPRLKEMMTRAGVLGEPRIYYLDEIEQVRELQTTIASSTG